MTAAQARQARLVTAALGCYPARWRRRHGGEAAEVAGLLIREGRPAASIAWSFFVGAAREWLAPRRARSLRTVAAGLLAAACLLGMSAALIAETGPAKAAGTTQAHGSSARATSTPVPCSRQGIQGSAHARPC
jgi:hypothetical protein